MTTGDDFEQYLLGVLASNLKRRFKLSNKQILDLLKKEDQMSLPFSIFTPELGMLESSCIYMHDTLKLGFNEIAELLKRDYKTVWSSYNKGKKKLDK